MGTAQATATFPSPYELSPNWSGAYIEARSRGIFVQVTAKWGEPTLKLPPPRFRIATGKYAASTWVGIGGQGRYYGSSLPQVGTEQKISAEDPKESSSSQNNSRAFFHWFSAFERTINRVYLDGICVCPGDLVAGMVWVSTQKCVHAFFRHFGTGNITIYCAKAQQDILPNCTKSPVKVAGATAEWIVGRPAQVSGGNVIGEAILFPFPDYGRTTFKHCIAGLATCPGPPTEGAALDGNRYIRLTQTTTKPVQNKLLIVSKPRKLSATSLMVEYVGDQD